MKRRMTDSELEAMIDGMAYFQVSFQSWNKILKAKFTDSSIAVFFSGDSS